MNNNKIISYGRQHITEEDIKAVSDTLRSDFLTQGPKILEFEVAFAKYIGCEYAVAVANGTAALHLSTLALGVTTGQTVITSPITFSASANCVKYCGGNVAFADINPQTYLIDIDQVRQTILEAPRENFVGIIAVDFAGKAVNLEALRQLANDHGLWIIEDACHAPGGYFTDSSGEAQLCGNGKFADLAIFSFHPVKHIACGEGGMITTNNRDLYEKLLMLRTHGITRDTKNYINDPNTASGNQEIISDEYPGWYMEMQELGYNYRLTDFQAALGLSQLQRADAGLKRRREIAERYSKAFSGMYWLKGQSGYEISHAYHLYIIEVDDRLGLYNYLRSKNIYCQVHYIPVHLMPYYAGQGFEPGCYKAAEAYYSKCLSIPMYPSLTDLEVDHVIEMITSYYR